MAGAGCDLNNLDLDQFKQLNEFLIGSWPPLCLLVLTVFPDNGKTVSIIVTQVHLNSSSENCLSLFCC